VPVGRVAQYINVKIDKKGFVPLKEKVNEENKN